MDTLRSFSVPAGPDFNDRLARVLRAALDKSGWRFSCEGDEYTSDEVTAPDGLLPMWMFRAQGLMAQAFGGAQAPMEFRLTGGALCGVLPEPPESGMSASLSVWACFVHYAFEEWRAQHAKLAAKGEPVPMDELYAGWKVAVRSPQFAKLPPLPPPTLPGLGLPLNPVGEMARTG